MLRSKNLPNGDKLYFIDQGREIHASLKNLDNVTGVGWTDKEAATDLAKELREYAATIEESVREKTGKIG
jgi:hypothetical protein